MPRSRDPVVLSEVEPRGEGAAKGRGDPVVREDNEHLAKVIRLNGAELSDDSVVYACSAGERLHPCIVKSLIHGSESETKVRETT